MKDIRVCGRGSQGVTLMDVRGDDRLIHLVRVAEDDVEEKQEVTALDAASEAPAEVTAVEPTDDVTVE